MKNDGDTPPTPYRGYFFGEHLNGGGPRQNEKFSLNKNFSKK